MDYGPLPPLLGIMSWSRDHLLLSYQQGDNRGRWVQQEVPRYRKDLVPGSGKGTLSASLWRREDGTGLRFTISRFRSRSQCLLPADSSVFDLSSSKRTHGNTGYRSIKQQHQKEQGNHPLNQKEQRNHPLINRTRMPTVAASWKAFSRPMPQRGTPLPSVPTGT